MKNRSISREDIDHALTMAMQATVAAMIDEGLIEESSGVDFADSHVCLPVNEDNTWHRIRRWIGLEEKEGVSRAIVFKVATKRD